MGSRYSGARGGRGGRRVMAAFITRMRIEDEPCRPKGISFHSNWPRWQRKLVFRKSASRRRT